MTMNGGEMEVLSSGIPHSYRFSEPGILFLRSKMTWSDLTVFSDSAGEIFAVRYGGADAGTGIELFPEKLESAYLFVSRFST